MKFRLFSPLYKLQLVVFVNVLGFTRFVVGSKLHNFILSLCLQDVSGNTENLVALAESLITRTKGFQHLSSDNNSPEMNVILNKAAG